MEEGKKRRKKERKRKREKERNMVHKTTRSK
jgi:hypothetical protein